MWETCASAGVREFFADDLPLAVIAFRPHGNQKLTADTLRTKYPGHSRRQRFSSRCDTVSELPHGIRHRCHDRAIIRMDAGGGGREGTEIAG